MLRVVPCTHVGEVQEREGWRVYDEGGELNGRGGDGCSCVVVITTSSAAACCCALLSVADFVRRAIDFSHALRIVLNRMSMFPSLSSRSSSSYTVAENTKTASASTTDELKTYIATVEYNMNY